MKSFLVSTLQTRFGAATPEELRKEHPHDWILWEPGSWKPPQKAPGTLILDKNPTPPPQAAGEALVLALEGAVAGQVSLGRSVDCDLSINDATLSGTHLVFMRAETGWTVRDAGSSNGTWLDGQPLQAGQPVPLRSGALLQAGQVNLRYYDAAALHARLRSLAKR